MKGNVNYQQQLLELEHGGEHPYLRLPGKFKHVLKPPEECGPNDICLYNLTRHDWEERGMGLTINFTGWDSCLEREVYETWQYYAHQIKFDRHFADCISYGKDRKVVVDMRFFNTTQADVTFVTRLRSKALFCVFRKYMGEKKELRDFLSRFVSQEQDITTIINAASEHNLASLHQLAEAGKDGLHDIGVSTHIEEILDGLQEFQCA